MFWRGFAGYDVRALEYGRGKWGQKFWGSYSGVRLPPGQTKWSFGRRLEITHDMTEAELTALGVWTEPTGAPRHGARSLGPLFRGVMKRAWRARWS